MTTMLEVAKRAGVSKATVSRVLSGNGYVSQETKDRVFQAIEESGYRPNLLARSLAAKPDTTAMRRFRSSPPPSASRAISACIST